MTKGRILNHEGQTGPQVDILVLSPSYPRALLDKKVYLAGGVAAAFECKITLRAKDIEDVTKNAALIQNLLPKREGSPFKELQSPLLYGLLAHSHCWKSPASTPVENIDTNLRSQDNNHSKHPREMLDFLCVADLATWVATKFVFIGPYDAQRWERIKDAYGPNGSAITSHVAESSSSLNQVKGFTPVGGLLTNLLRKLAWENREMRPLAQYFMEAKIEGAGAGGMRLWPIEIYSEKIRPQIQAGGMKQGVLWDEWSQHFW